MGDWSRRSVGRIVEVWYCCKARDSDATAPKAGIQQVALAAARKPMVIYSIYNLNTVSGRKKEERAGELREPAGAETLGASGINFASVKLMLP